MLLNKHIKRIPTIVIFTALVVSFLSSFIDMNYLIVGNTIGYSILFNLVFIYFLYRLKYCIHTKLAMINLTVLNVFNILDGLGIMDYDSYSFNYNLLTTGFMIVSLGVYCLSKKTKKN